MSHLKLSLSLLGLALVLGGCKRDELAELHEAEGALRDVVALEAAELVAGNKGVVLIVQDVKEGPVADSNSAFKSALEKKGLNIVATKAVNLGDPMSYGTFGLTYRDFHEALINHKDAGAIISLVGAPIVSLSALNDVPSTHPPILVVSVRQIGEAPGVVSNPGLIEQLAAAKVLQVAIMDGAGASGKTDKAYKTFDQNFQILRGRQ